MEPVVFSSADGGDAQEAFQRWQADNPAGFYINRKAATQGMLHRVGCGHVGQPGEWDPGVKRHPSFPFSDNSISCSAGPLRGPPGDN
jgi:hypothetical protein